MPYCTKPYAICTLSGAVLKKTQKERRILTVFLTVALVEVGATVSVNFLDPIPLSSITS